MKYLFILLFAVCSMDAISQWKSYRLTNRGDTINCVDQQDKKQGKWSLSVDGLRGEPGYDEEGVYEDGKKEGIWRVYTTMGDLYAIESYRWGNRDGKCQYYNISGLIREESWKAVNPDNPYDTVDVPDPVDPFKVERKVVKMEGSSVRHGTWSFFESGSGSLYKSETYFLGKLQDPMKAFAANKEVSHTADDTTFAEKPPTKIKPKEVMNFEKKTGKKKVKVLDGSTF